MCKLFKEFDKKYAAFAGSGIKNLNIPPEKFELYLEPYTCWDQEAWGLYLTYPQEKVQWAVYHAEGFEDWQKFRVSLKGLTTREKLLCLGSYITQHMNRGERETLLTQIRVNNYLGALIRGGQLNDKLEVQR